MKTLFTLFALSLVSVSSFGETVDPCLTPAAKSAASAAQRIITGVAIQNGIAAGSFATSVTACSPNVDKIVSPGFGDRFMRAAICGASYVFANPQDMKQFALAVAANSNASRTCLSLHSSFPRH